MSHTVVVIGFYGSKRRHVEKYANAWERHVPGVKSVVLNECSGTLSLLTLGIHRDAKRIANELKDERNVVFHVMSNRGMGVYLETVRLLSSNVKIDGVIFDSCEFCLSSFFLYIFIYIHRQTNMLTRNDDFFFFWLVQVRARYHLGYSFELLLPMRRIRN